MSSEILTAEAAAPAPDAAVCVAIGCHEREDLRRVTDGDRTRVLCPTHAEDFLPREVKS